MGKILSILIAFFALAAAPASADVRSSQILARLSSTLDSLGGYRADFRAEFDGDRTTGLYMVYGRSYYMKVGDMEVFSDGASRYEVNHTNREITVDVVNPSDKNILSNPARAFQFPDDVFVHSYAGSESVEGRQCDVVVIKPIPGVKQPFTRITLCVGAADGRPVRISYADQGLPDEVRIVITSFNPKAKLDEGIFRFDPARYAGYETIDFR